jgi:hypothetical protein
MISDFQKIRVDTKAYLSKYQKIQKTYHKTRSHFKKSIAMLTERGHKVGKALNCKGVRRHFANALGNVCYNRFTTYHTAYVAWLLIGSGIFLFFLSLVKLLDVVTHSVDGGDQLGFELGGL